MDTPIEGQQELKLIFWDAITHIISNHDIAYSGRGRQGEFAPDFSSLRRFVVVRGGREFGPLAGKLSADGCRNRGSSALPVCDPLSFAG